MLRADSWSVLREHSWRGSGDPAGVKPGSATGQASAQHVCHSSPDHEMFLCKPDKSAPLARAARTCPRVPAQTPPSQVPGEGRPSGRAREKTMQGLPQIQRFRCFSSLPNQLSQWGQLLAPHSLEGGAPRPGLPQPRAHKGQCLQRCAGVEHVSWVQGQPWWVLSTCQGCPGGLGTQ